MESEPTADLILSEIMLWGEQVEGEGEDEVGVSNWHWEGEKRIFWSAREGAANASEEG